MPAPAMEAGKHPDRVHRDECFMLASVAMRIAIAMTASATMPREKTSR